MLTREDLQAIAAIMDDKITASEERTAKKIDSATTASQNALKAYIENTIAKDVKIIAEGHMALNEKLDRILDRIEVAEDFEPRVSALEAKVKENCADIQELKKAQ